jgi:hypothetical protein
VAGRSPDPYMWWIQVLSTLLTPVIVAIAVYVARQQWRRAHTKFRRDYYDRRLQIYRAAMTLVLVYRLLNPLGFVAFKMGRRQGGPSRTRSARITSDMGASLAP